MKEYTSRPPYHEKGNYMEGDSYLCRTPFREWGHDIHNFSPVYMFYMVYFDFLTNFLLTCAPPSFHSIYFLVLSYIRQDRSGGSANGLGESKNRLNGDTKGSDRGRNQIN
jgi:hypothetical protein